MIFLKNLRSRKGRTQIIKPNVFQMLQTAYTINFQLQANWPQQVSMEEVFQLQIIWLLRSIVHNALNVVHERCLYFIYNYIW